MTQAAAGQTVRIHYTGTLDDGSTFDSSIGRDPLEFQLGSGQIIPGLDNAIVGMAIGDSKQVAIQPADAYGEREEGMIQSVPVSALPDDIQPAVGMQLQGQSAEGQVTQFVITEVNDESITVDANHPLAGKVLHFDVELVEFV